MSAEFKCQKDQDNIYFGINVNDNELVFGEKMFELPFWDDCIEIIIKNLSSPFPLKLWISSDAKGKIRLDGRKPIGNLSYPFLWNNKGILAAQKKAEKGYSVEVMLPKNILS